MKIFGAGMAGLLAGIADPRAIIYEKNKKPVQQHQALLRFRTKDVSDLTGIKFKKVRVIKAIWSDGKECQPSPRLIAMYSSKNTGCYENRSIMDIDSVTRYIAPDNFYDLLVKECEDRINFGREIIKDDFVSKREKDIISTLPLSFNASMLGYDFKTDKNQTVIYVSTFLIQNCDMYATVYYPDSTTPIYRASITGNRLIIESKDKIIDLDLDIDMNMIIDSFGLKNGGLSILLKNHVQNIGKITSINDSERRIMIYKMSHDHGVFSLGRFALHKNILLDDVAQDIRVIRAMKNDDTYGISIMDRV